MPVVAYQVSGEYAMLEAAARTVRRARNGGGPSFLECRTYRFCGHHTAERTMKLAYRTEDPDFLLTCRPYSATELGVLLRRMRQAQLATTQLHALQRGAGEGKAVFLNTLRYQVARKPAGPRYLAWMKSFDFDPAVDVLTRLVQVVAAQNDRRTGISSGSTAASIV